MAMAALPKGVKSITFGNPRRANALSRETLATLLQQLRTALTPDDAPQPLLLHTNRRQLGPTRCTMDIAHPISRAQLARLPRAIVLRSAGPVFCAGHDLGELGKLSRREREGVFDLCAEVMRTIRRSPVPVVCPVQGLATAAGFQLAMTTDLPIALADTLFCLPGMKIGLPCTSPATAVSRRIPPALAYRMFAMGDNVRADGLFGAVDVVAVPEEDTPEKRSEALEKRVEEVVRRIALDTSPIAQAAGKWSFWRQHSLSPDPGEGEGDDPIHQATLWAGKIMAADLETQEAEEGSAAFLGKRKPVWPE